MAGISAPRCPFEGFEIRVPFGDLVLVLLVLEVRFGAAAGQAGPPKQHAQRLRSQGNLVFLRQPFGQLRQGPGAVLLGESVLERL